MKHYYIENASAGKFAIIDEALKAIVEEFYNDEDLFIRPMDDKEIWDNTITHETRADKQYYVLDDHADLEEFMEA